MEREHILEKTFRERERSFLGEEGRTYGDKPEALDTTFPAIPSHTPTHLNRYPHTFGGAGDNTGFMFSLLCKSQLFLSLRYLSWRPLHVTKTMSEDVRAFSTIENFILLT